MLQLAEAVAHAVGKRRNPHDRRARTKSGLNFVPTCRSWLNAVDGFSRC